MVYLKTFEVYKVIDFIFTRQNLHLLEGYIYYNLQLCLLPIYEVTFIIDLYLKTFEIMIYYNVLYSYRFYIYQKFLFIIIKDSYYEV